MTNLNKTKLIPAHIEAAADRLGTDLSTITEIGKKIDIWTRMCVNQDLVFESRSGSAFIASAIKLKMGGAPEPVYTARLIGKYLQLYYNHISNHGTQPKCAVKDVVTQQYLLDQAVHTKVFTDEVKIIARAVRGIEVYLGKNLKYDSKGKVDLSF